MGIASTIERAYRLTENSYFAVGKRKLRRGYLTADSSGQWIADIVTLFYHFVEFEQIFILKLISKGMHPFALTSFLCSICERKENSIQFN
jgi:hypothetical protein